MDLGPIGSSPFVCHVAAFFVNFYCSIFSSNYFAQVDCIAIVFGYVKVESNDNLSH